MNELIAQGFTLDLADNIAVPINYAIADIKDPTKRKRNFSKTIVLPDTSNNRKFFGGAFSLHVTENAINFDATKKVEAVLKKNGVPIMTDAVIKLNKVTRKDKDLEFDITLFSESVDYFLLLSNILVNELDWSAYDHALTKANIEASWSATAGTGYYYPLIERGNDRIGTTTWRTTDFIPYVYHREVLIKVLEYAGIEYDSDFIDSTRYKNVLFGFGGGQQLALTTADINSREVDADTLDFVATQTGTNYLNTQPNGTQQVYTNFYPIQIDSTNSTYTENTDDLDQLDDFAISVQKTGNYLLDFEIEIDYTYDIGTMSVVSATSPKVQVYRNGNVIAASTEANGSSLSGVINLTVNQNVYLQSGDFLEFKVVPPNNIVSEVNTTVDQVTLTMDSNSSGTLNLSCVDTLVTDGSTVSLNNALPAMKCSDFLLGTIRQFNLYLSDPDIYNVVDIEPLPSYYQSTLQFDDISNLIDYDKDFVIKPIANEQPKEFIFEYKENKDQDAQDYLEKWDERYGDYTYTQGSYYAKGQKKISLPWSGIVPYEIATGILVPRFITIDESGNVKQLKGNARIMMRNGNKTGNWTFVLGNGGTPTYKTTYPCVHHFDDWENPTFDLNFKLVTEVFYSATVVTTVNCYSEYYNEFINEITNASAKMLECYVKWKAQDIYSMDFSKLKMINGSLWRLNAIIDFDSDIQESTKVELSKVLEARSPRQVQIPISGGTLNPNVPTMISPPNGVGTDVGVVRGGNNEVLRYSQTINK